MAYRTSTDHAAPKVTLKVTMVSARVRTAALPQSQRSPSTISRRAGLRVDGSTPCGGRTMREMARALMTMARVCATNGTMASAAKSAAPIGGPRNWLMVTKPAITLAFPKPSSRRWTIIGKSVWEVVSANVSAVPSKNMAVSTTTMSTRSVAIVAVKPTSTAERTNCTVSRMRRRSRRSATTPA